MCVPRKKADNNNYFYVEILNDLLFCSLSGRDRKYFDGKFSLKRLHDDIIGNVSKHIIINTQHFMHGVHDPTRKMYEMYFLLCKHMIQDSLWLK